MKTVKKSKPKSQGIKSLWLELQRAREDGEKLFHYGTARVQMASVAKHLLFNDKQVARFCI